MSNVNVLEYDSDDFEDEFTSAPQDLYGRHQDLGSVLVVRKGESLPKITKYISKPDCSVSVRFR